MFSIFCKIKMNIGKKTYSKMKETEEEHDILINAI